MKKLKTILSILIVYLLFSSALFAQNLKKVEKFTLKNYDGKSYSLTDFKDSKAIVIMFIATQCPVSNDYNERMVKIYEDYENKGITFIGINSNKQESVEEIEKHSEENNFKFPVLKDINNIIADKYGAAVTPEIFVVNANLELLYHGRIDDNRKANKVEVNDLRNALDEILSGKQVSVQSTKAFGCTIKRVNK